MGKKDLKKIVDNSGPVVDKINPKILREIGRRMHKYQEIARWMSEHFDAIFARAPNNEEYAVGIWERKVPRILYFNNKNSPECLAVSREHPSFLIYRHPDNFQ